jgi:hypothetical protein
MKQGAVSTIFRMGEVNQTREHDWKHAFMMFLLVLIVTGILWWAYEMGHLASMVKAVGWPVTTFFGVLLAAGVHKGFQLSREVSREINQIKRINDPAKLLEVFGIEAFNGLSFTYVCRRVGRNLTGRISGLPELAEFSMNVGFLGTLIGLLIGFSSFAEITVFNQENLLPHMPRFFFGLGFAFWSSIAGLAVSMVARRMELMLWRSSSALEDKVERAFYKAMAGKKIGADFEEMGNV